MKRVVKLLVYMIVLALLALAAYAYLGPYFGADFSPPQTEIKEPVTLDEN